LASFSASFCFFLASLSLVFITAFGNKRVRAHAQDVNTRCAIPHKQTKSLRTRCRDVGGEFGCRFWRSKRESITRRSELSRKR
jgi:hypothetical protein